MNTQIEYYPSAYSMLGALLTMAVEQGEPQGAGLADATDWLNNVGDAVLISALTHGPYRVTIEPNIELEFDKGFLPDGEYYYGRKGETLQSICPMGRITIEPVFASEVPQSTCEIQNVIRHLQSCLSSPAVTWAPGQREAAEEAVAGALKQLGVAT